MTWFLQLANIHYLLLFVRSATFPALSPPPHPPLSLPPLSLPQAVPEAPPKPKPTEKSKIEKTLEKMEKKFGKTEGERECQCILDGGRCGRFVKGKGCVAVPGAVAETTDGATEKAKMAGAPGMDGASGGDAAGDSAAEKKKESSDESLLSRVEELETQLKSKLGKSKKKVATLKFL